MCGYCYEGIVLHVVESGQRYTKGYRFSYLQESDDIKTEIQQLEDPNNPEPLIDLAFCRLYDHYFARGFDVELFNILQESEVPPVFRHPTGEQFYAISLCFC